MKSFKKDVYSNNCCKQTAIWLWRIKMCKMHVVPKTSDKRQWHHITSLLFVYYWKAIQFASKSESGFTINPNLNSIIEYPQSLANTSWTQEAFEKCWAHSPLRAATRPNFTLPFTGCRYCRTPPTHRCPRQQWQRQCATEGTAMAP